MEDVLKYVAEALVENPDKVEVTRVESEGATILQLRVDPEDLGRVIGRHGRVAKAMRTVVKAAATRRGERVLIEIVE